MGVNKTATLVAAGRMVQKDACSLLLTHEEIFCSGPAWIGIPAQQQLQGQTQLVRDVPCFCLVQLNLVFSATDSTVETGKERLLSCL